MANKVPVEPTFESVWGVLESLVKMLAEEYSRDYNIPIIIHGKGIVSSVSPESLFAFTYASDGSYCIHGFPERVVGHALSVMGNRRKVDLEKAEEFFRGIFRHELRHFEQYKWSMANGVDHFKLHNVAYGTFPYLRNPLELDAFDAQIFEAEPIEIAMPVIMEMIVKEVVANG